MHSFTHSLIHSPLIIRHLSALYSLKLSKVERHFPLFYCQRYTYEHTLMAVDFALSPSAFSEFKVLYAKYITVKWQSLYFISIQLFTLHSLLWIDGGPFVNASPCVCVWERERRVWITFSVQSINLCAVTLHSFSHQVSRSILGALAFLFIRSLSLPLCLTCACIAQFLSLSVCLSACVSRSRYSKKMHHSVHSQDPLVALSVCVQ